jgi:YesN/AraC family two-component response regulator
MLRLLIVDDEQIIREALSEMIDYPSLGYELVATAKNGMEAYNIICDEYPDVIITDIRMPILNGLDLIEKAIKTDKHIIFIVLSGYSEFEYAQRAMKYGVKHYLLKPTVKQELIDTLVVIQKEVTHKILLKKQEQQNILNNLQAPLQQSFIREALEHLQDFHDVFEKYQRLLALSEDYHIACLCYFVEERYLAHFVRNINRLLDSLHVVLQFPVIYVKNTAIIIAPLKTLSLQETIKSRILKLNYDGQSTTFDINFLHLETSEQLFGNIIKKISRYEKIFLCSSDYEIYEIFNSLISPQKLQQVINALYQSNSSIQRDTLLLTLFPDSQSIQTAITFAVSLFMEMNIEFTNSIDFAFDFFKKLYSCSSANEIRELFQTILSELSNKDTSKANNILRLKNYVEQHLRSETLSLKWLAENYLFINVSYLSKQFIKEEGIRFSEYLNKKRMDEAINLMRIYKHDNIKNIAKQIGFGNNPQYFSQVFKKYTGYTPSDYIKTFKE